MNQIPLRVGSPFPAPPVASAPPILNDITNIKLVNKRKAVDDNSVTDAELAAIEVEEMRVLSISICYI